MHASTSHAFPWQHAHFSSFRSCRNVLVKKKEIMALAALRVG
jgi:hypothetical protein